MSDSANVKSLDALRTFTSAVIRFREEAKICVTRLESEMQKMIGWLERDRPGFWKREGENCDRRFAEARVRLHQCRMRRVGDFRPTCFEEQKALEHCKHELEVARKQLGVVRHWTIAAHQEADEYYGRASQLTQMLERDLPMLIALLQRATERLDSYGKVHLPDWSPGKLDFGDPAAYGDSSSPHSDAAGDDPADPDDASTEETSL